jgi:hypothetical protein
VGTWGVDIFSDDTACDIRNYYRDLLEDGVDDAIATRRTLETFQGEFEEPRGIAIVALAVTQSKLGRLEADVRDRALAALDAGADLDAWKEDNPKLVPKRRAVLEKARAQLTGRQPARKRVRPAKRESSGLAAGDVLAFPLPHRIALVRVVRVHSHRLGETPVIEELDFDGTEVPPRDVLERLGPKADDPATFKHPLASDTRLATIVVQRIDWQAAGFQKVQTIATRPGDEQAPVPSSGISWAALADRYRRQRGA